MVIGSWMTHQVTELVGTVARLVVGDRGYRTVHVNAVALQSSVLFAVKYEALFTIDGSGWIKDGETEVGVDTKELRRL